MTDDLVAPDDDGEVIRQREWPSCVTVVSTHRRGLDDGGAYQVARIVDEWAARTWAERTGRPAWCFRGVE